jgi:hypothetical protein
LSIFRASTTTPSVWRGSGSATTSSSSLFLTNIQLNRQDRSVRLPPPSSGPHVASFSRQRPPALQPSVWTFELIRGNPPVPYFSKVCITSPARPRPLSARLLQALMLRLPADSACLLCSLQFGLSNQSGEILQFLVAQRCVYD